MRLHPGQAAGEGPGAALPRLLAHASRRGVHTAAPPHLRLHVRRLAALLQVLCQLPGTPTTSTPPPLLPQHNGSLEIARAPQVGNAETPELKASRLGLLVVVVNTLKVGFDLLGMSTLDAM